MYGYSVPPEPPRNRGEGRIRVLVGVVLVTFAVTLAVVIGQRLSDQAMAVLSGAVCGVGASIPTSLLIIWVTRRREEQRPTRPAAGPYPPVVVVQPPAQPAMPSAQQSGYMAPYLPPVQREFTIVGEQMEEVRYGGYR
ncbi:MAG TPA: hypothetical protein EYH30_05170 [Anaerolineales bacterium]|nr:hypothetical protein [Anaerolineales bacterium]